MYELRQNVATREWVIIATGREQRPKELSQGKRLSTAERPAWVAECPFCPGNEDPDLDVVRIPGEGPWQARVIRNKYPALQRDGERKHTLNGIHQRMSAVGYHEVVVESRRHNTSAALQTPAEVTRVLSAIQSRGRTMAKDPRVEHIIYFENHGPRAGATLTHPHAQLTALPVVPYNVRARSKEARHHFDDTGACVYCRMLTDALQDGSRIVIESDLFTAFVPYAACSPFHIWILPHRHNSSFLKATGEELDDLGKVLHRVLRKLYLGLQDPDYNYIIRSAPVKDVGQGYNHWYVAILPRLSPSTGFELGTGVFINTSRPAESAEFLRSIAADS